MLVDSAHLSYCTNIHAGDGWQEHFDALKTNLPKVKQRLSPDRAFGIGLRISNRASHELQSEENFQEFTNWLDANDMYIFTMNGFPYGEFHHEEVKENVHSPDWTSTDRLFYTLRLIGILAKFLPDGMDGGISTSPLSYRRWFKTEETKKIATQVATRNIIEVVEQLYRIKHVSDKILHLDIEPEPDGLLETGDEFLNWYHEYLIPIGRQHFQNKFNLDEGKADEVIKTHVRLCYDVCHFALGYEDHEEMMRKLEAEQILIGKFQISAALKANLPKEPRKRQMVTQAFAEFDEPTYLHQVIAQTDTGKIRRYKDLPDALADADHPDTQDATEWRAHFHVPVFLSEYELLESTQQDILKVLDLHKEKRRTAHIEVETYTWNVLPKDLKRPLEDSIIRELTWVRDELTK